MEMDNETVIAGESGTGNSYSTLFRQLNPRLGRWLSVDPEASSYPGVNPYIAFGNNPVMFVDPWGDVITSGLEEWVDNVNEGYDKKIGAYETELVDELSQDNNEEGIETATNNLNYALQEKSLYNSKMNDLRKSHYVYDRGRFLHESDYVSHDGLTFWDGNCIKFDVAWGGKTAETRHEFEHMWQFEMGKISFTKGTRKAGLLYDPYDELEAFNASRIFDDNEHTNINNLPDSYYDDNRWNRWGSKFNWTIQSNRDVNNYKDKLIFMTPESYRQNRIDNLNTSNNIYNEKRIK